MLVDEITQPCLKRHVETVAERIGRIRAKRVEHLQGVRVQLLQAKDLGAELLELKAACVAEQQDWLPILEKTGFGDKQARKYMRIAAYWETIFNHKDFNSSTNINDAIELIADKKESWEVAHGPPGGDAGQTSSQTDEPIFCRECRIRGPKKNCKDCKELRNPSGEDNEEEEGDAQASAPKKRGSKPVASSVATKPKGEKCPTCGRKLGADKFVRPTVEEVAAYCQERKNKVDPQTFVDFYTSKGWVVGKVPMKDWRAAVRTWEKNAGRKGSDLHSGIKEWLEREGEL